MANLKMDLLNQIRVKKYLAEIELVRLAADPNMNYELKLNEMEFYLEKIAHTNQKMELVELYFQEQPQQQGAQPINVNPNQPVSGGAVQQQPQGHVHPGQSHGEG